MKKVIIYTFTICIAYTSAAQTTSVSPVRLNQRLEEKMQERTIPGAQLGILICEDENGHWQICSGSEFEEIKGFATSVPYVTANKVPKGQNRTVFSAIASASAGPISIGDYLCACEQNPGMVKKCDRTDFPYAKAMDGATSDGQRVKARILGYRRN